MLSGRTVPIDTIIEMLYRDYGFESVERAEVAEWIWTSMSIIGSPYPYEDKPIELNVTYNRSPLPLDLYSITAVREKVSGIVLREMTNVFNLFDDTAYEGAIEIIADYDPASNERAYYSTIIGPDGSSEYYTYKVQGNMMYFGFATGTVEMQYKAIPIDIVTGMPTVPDDPTYIRGVVSFIAERMAFRMMLKDLLSERKYEIISRDAAFNIGAARNSTHKLDPARMETMINRWKSTYLGPEHFDLGLKYLGSRE